VIEEINIRDLGVIQQTRLSFGAGLNVITGETGAGKTMVLSALGLLLGSRADSSMIRAGQSQAYVEGRWMLANSPEVVARVVEAGGVAADGELLVNRSVSADGRSRVSIGGSAAPVGLLAELSENLVVVHGQSDQIRLKSASAQREALDEFCGVRFAELTSTYQRAYSQAKILDKQLAELKSNLGDHQQQLADYQQALNEIQAVKPVAGEDIALAELAAKLTHAQDIRVAVKIAHDALSSEAFDANDAVSTVGVARKSLDQVSVHDSKLSDLVENLKQIGFALTDAAAELSGYLAELENDAEAELAVVQQRRSELSSLMRKFGPSLDDVLELEQRALLALDNTDLSGQGLHKLELELAEAWGEARELAHKLSEMRAEGASTLEKLVTAELHGLAMAGASLVVSVTRTDQLGPHGFDDVAINLSAYPGAEPRALGKGASGGELSRIMLALEVVLAQTKPVPTFIFDEVDAGVGGAAAIEVGRRLSRLSKQAQVIVVTHLAQVAAFADHHQRVEKATDATFTATSVSVVEHQSRATELARMLSGLSDSETARVHAQELMALAREVH
jgi:DNA repair protein RecN (Recombination protein N)